MVRKRNVTFTCIFLLHVVFGAQPPAAGVDPSECRSLMDLFFVIDGSDSIDAASFKLLQEAIASIIPEIDLGPNKARIGMLVYSSNVPDTSKHNLTFDRDYLINAAYTLEHPRDGTNTRLGIEAMRLNFLHNGRDDVPWVGVVITDGISKRPPQTIEEAQKAAKMGISMFAVGVGLKIAPKELENIASTKNQAMMIRDFSELKNILKSMMFQICPCPVPPVLPNAKCNDGPRAIGTVRTYECLPGYLLRGDPKIQCQSDFSWTPLDVNFECVPCSDKTPVIQHATCGSGDVLIGSVRSYTCETGYRGIGTMTTECLKTGAWSLPSFQCVPCGDTPVIPHGICGIGDFTIGSVRRFSCEPGYRLIGQDSITCMDDLSWAKPQWSKPDVQCVPCGDTPVIPHGICGIGDFTIGSVRRFSCEPGYRLIGQDSITCMDDLSWAKPQWSKPDVQCVPCGETPVIPHGICAIGDFIIGSIRRFTCEPGYRLIGQDTITCMDDLSWATPQWSTPDVQCVPCGDTPVIPHGICDVGDFIIGSIRRFTCEPGYRLIGQDTITCMDDLSWASPQWSTPDVQCVPCGDTPVIPHGICDVGDFTIGSVRRFSCEPGYRLIGQDSITCMDDLSWAKPQWSKPDVQCVPCGDTPVIPHGICGIGDFTIGSVRRFSCEPGYRLIGQDSITCMDDLSWAKPQWSKPDVQCVPCGETPVIPHGICAIGDFIIGSIRRFTCEPGYRLIGQDTITCMDDLSWATPQWSTPDVQCVPCGDTPVIPHGICDIGDFIIGSIRRFTCEPGYRLIGQDTITCMDDLSWASPQWSTPDVQCVPCGDTPVIPHGICDVGDFTIGSVRRFSCEPGFRLIGQDTITCMDDLSWAIPQWSTPTLQCVPCGDLPIIPNGIFGVGKFIIGSLRRFSCEPGYRLIGQDTITCMDDLSWASPQWSTTDVQCVHCGDTPAIPHGICGVGDFTIGSIRRFTCEPGYRLIGQDIITCMDDLSWATPQWSTPDVQCVPCGDIPVIPHGICGVGDFTIGSIRRFTCEPGYRLIGQDTITCMDDLSWVSPQWSMPDFQCVPCGETPVIPHGICGVGDFTIGSIRRFTCEPGYRLIGQDTITCMDDLSWVSPQWSMPDVQCVPCGDTPVIPHGICGVGDFTIGSIRRFTCEPGYRLIGQDTITCMDDLSWVSPQWSMPDVQCVPCGDTPVIPHGICGVGDFTIGSIRRFTCEPGYRLIGQDTITCMDDLSWVSPQWSTPDVQCVPCGDTPVIPHGICGVGDFTIGSIRRFTCEPGFRLIGQDTITCMDDLSWVSPQWSTPDVQCVPCGGTPVIPHGICGVGDFTIGSIRRFTCEPGYRLIGQDTITCMDDLSWASPQWSMPDVQCVPCGDTPVIPHGICGVGDFTIGSIRRFSCEPGYRLIGQDTITCMDDLSWASPQWSMPDVQCVPCGDTPVIPHGICGVGDFTIGSIRKFTCEPGYRLIGQDTITCMDDLSWAIPQWSTPNLHCVPCGDLPIIPHGIFGVGKFIIGSLRRFSCEPGYRLIGQDTITCMDDLSGASPQWSTTDVQCVPCGDTPAIPHGICGIGDFTIGSVRRFTCEPGYRLIGQDTITCMDDLSWVSPQWSMPDVQCVPCGDTPVIPHGICGVGDFTIGSIRRVSCEPGYRLIGQDTITCMDDLSWVSPQWSMPDVQCVPCGDTPVIPHGICGVGDFIIGSIRRFTCEPGYRMIGQDTITCMDDLTWVSPQWSMPDVKCVPCGDTPVITHGICGVGDFTIGSIRSFTCEPGYRLIGQDTITCMDDLTWASPQWSMPDVQCVPCGDTPVIPHGICGVGDFTIGSIRRFTCEPGYRLIGQDTITCMDDLSWASPQWSTPGLQCVPCGDIPVIPHGFFDVGNVIIGSLRRFTCEPGYRLIGQDTITCMDDLSGTTPQWSTTDVQCVPCGDTPAIPHGICGVGDFTIGSIRKFTCEPGYRLIGQDTITCMDDLSWARPQWSKPDVKCAPCGNTPQVEHATCNDGASLIGSVRSYTCAEGYILDGNPDITCSDDATWSRTMFTCRHKGCGDPPIVANAYTGTGPSVIGSTRVYYCEEGFEMVGRGEIMCDRFGQWGYPQFSCKGIPPKFDDKDPSVCDGCRYLNGVGYANHPFDCNQYVQCYMGERGLEPVYRKCPFGLFWDQHVLTCRLSYEVHCPHDRCEDRSVFSYKHTDRNMCCAYWKCQKGKSYGECCGEGRSYNAATGQCEVDYDCENTCPFDDELPACDKRPALTENMFEQHIGNNHWVPMYCAPGTAFNPVDCECSLLIMNVPGKNRQQVCKPELFLPFSDGFRDRSGKNVYIKSENVSIHNGAAFFNGNSRIIINRFANTEFAGDLVIKFRYNEFRNGAYYDELQALVTNGDCGSDPSIVIAKMPGYVLLGAKAEFSRSFALPTLDYEWKEVIYIHNGKSLEGKVCGASMSKWSSGAIQATHCSLQIGYGNGLQSYVGLLDDLYIYQCRPRSSVLNINY